MTVAARPTGRPDSIPLSGRAGSRTQVYIGNALAGPGGPATRHITLVPHLPGVDALCGVPLVEARPGTLREALLSVVCPECRSRATTSAGLVPA
jgi:hypothetical protein